MYPRPLVPAAALLLDLALGEPPRRLHPVVGIGWLVDRVNWRRHAHPLSQFATGGAWSLVVVVVSAAIAAALETLPRRLPWWLRVAAEAALLKSMLSFGALVDAADRLSVDLARHDLGAARRHIRDLVSRDASDLDFPLLASAAVESVAENLSDSVVAPLLWYAIAGLPGAALYRAANTLDAMVGYHGPFEFSGKLAARLDDALNLIPARITALAIVAAAEPAGGSARDAWGTLLADHSSTESPNAGWPMSAMAGALGVRLEKPGHYVLAASSPRPDPVAVDHAVRIAIVATALALPVLSAASACIELVVAWTRRCRPRLR